MKKMSDKIVYRVHKLAHCGELSCGPCGDDVGYSLPGPQGCSA